MVDKIYQEHNHRINQWNDTLLNTGRQNVQCLYNIESLIKFI